MDGATARVLWSDELAVHYGFVHLGTEGAGPSGTSWARVTGLLALDEPGTVAMFTGTHTGPVPLTVTLHEVEPPVGEDWQDVAEVPWECDGTPAAVWAFETGAQLETLPAGTYRVRWSASGVDAAHDLTRSPGDPVVDRYALDLWPAPVAPPRLLRRTAVRARVGDDRTDTAPLPLDLPWPRPWVPLAEHREHLEAQEAAERARQEAEWRERHRVATWGPVPPTPLLESLGSGAARLSLLDRSLLDALVGAQAPAQRRVAVRAAAAVLAAGGDAARAALAEPLAELEAGRPLPAGFRDAPFSFLTDPGRPSERPGGVDGSWIEVLTVSDPAQTAFESIASRMAGPGREEEGRLRGVAVDALLAAGDPDPRRAAVEALAALLRVGDPGLVGRVARPLLDG